MSDWWKISRATGDTTRVDLYDDIGSDDSDPEFLNGLQAIHTPKIDLHINSDGGSVTTGLSIYNALKGHDAEVTAYVDSIAASIASVIALGADRLIMAPGSLMMIHNSRAGVGGDANRMRSVADQLDKMTGVIADLYAEKTKKPIDQIRAAMDKETWFDAEDAKAFGLCDEISGKSTIENTTRAMSAVMRLHRLPEKFRQNAERMVAQHNVQPTEIPMLKSYTKEGKTFVDIDGKPVEIEVQQPAPVNRVGNPDEDRTSQVAKAKEDAIKGEREYRSAFDTIAKTAGIQGEALAKFEKFYGRPLDDVKFLAENTIASRATPVGEGGDAHEGDAAKDQAAKDYVELKNSLTKRWDTDRDIRRVFRCQSNDPNSAEYKAKFQIYMRAELKCFADQKNPIPDRVNDGDRVGRMMSNPSLLTK